MEGRSRTSLAILLTWALSLLQYLPSGTTVTFSNSQNCSSTENQVLFLGFHNCWVLVLDGSQKAPILLALRELAPIARIP